MSTSKTLSRRSAIALVGASAIASTSTAISAIAPNTDAELLALGVKLEALIQEWFAGRAEDKRHGEAHDAACRVAGLPLDRESLSGAELRAQVEARSKVDFIGKNEFDADQDEHGCSIKWRRIHKQLYPLCDDILSRQATSVAGMGVQARATSLYFEELWDSYGSDDEALAVAQRSFIESVSAFSGVVPVPIEEAAHTGSTVPSRALKAPDEPDPIFALIDAHNAARDEIERYSLADEDTEAVNAECNRLFDAEYEGACALADVVPTSMAGAIALLEHLNEARFSIYGIPYGDDGMKKPFAFFVHNNIVELLKAVQS